MQLSTTFALATLLTIASAATSFEVVSIRSGSSLQYASVYVDNDTLYLGSGDSVQFVINDDKTLADAKTKKLINFKDNKFVEGDEGTKSVSISDSNTLLYNGKEVFNACPDGDKYTLSANKGCENGVGIRLRVNGKKDAEDVGAPKTDAPKTQASKTETPKTATKEPEPKKTEAPAPAQGETKFGIISVASGTKFQYSSIKRVDSHPHVFSVGGDEGKDVLLTLHSDGTLSDQDGRKIRVNENGEFGETDPWGQQQPTTGFAINDGHLTLGSSGWRACPSGDNKYSLANNDCVGGTGIVLHVVEQK